MKIIRRISKPAAIFLAFYMLILSGPYQSAWSAMVGTESIITVDRAKRAREYLNSFLERKEIQSALVS